MARKSCFSPLPACQIPVTRKLIFESLHFGNVSNEEKIKFKGSFFFPHRNSYRCFLCVNNPLTMPFRKFMAKGLPPISGPPYVFIIIFLCHFFLGCSCWCLLVEEQEDLCECTWWCHCLVGFLWVAWIPLSHSGLPYPNTLSGCPFPVVQCIHIY